MYKNRKGMTLVEVLVSTVLLCTVIFFILPIINFIHSESKLMHEKRLILIELHNALLVEELEHLRQKKALDIYEVDYGHYEEICAKIKNNKEKSEHLCFVTRVDLPYMNN